MKTLICAVVALAFVGTVDAGHPSRVNNNGNHATHTGHNHGHSHHGQQFFAARHYCPPVVIPTYLPPIDPAALLLAQQQQALLAAQQQQLFLSQQQYNPLGYGALNYGALNLRSYSYFPLNTGYGSCGVGGFSVGVHGRCR